MMWSREELAWAAGLFEGEGCVGRYITTKRSVKYDYWQVRISSTDLDVLRKFQRIIGFGKIYKHKTTGARKRAWQHNIYRQPEVYAVLALLFQFMGSRRKAKMREALMEMGARQPWRVARN